MRFLKGNLNSRLLAASVVGIVLSLYLTHLEHVRLALWHSNPGAAQATEMAKLIRLSSLRGAVPDGVLACGVITLAVEGLAFFLRGEWRRASRGGRAPAQ